MKKMRFTISYKVYFETQLGKTMRSFPISNQPLILQPAIMEFDWVGYEVPPIELCKIYSFYLKKMDKENGFNSVQFLSTNISYGKIPEDKEVFELNIPANFNYEDSSDLRKVIDNNILYNFIKNIIPETLKVDNYGDPGFFHNIN